MNKFIDELEGYNIAITGRASTAIYAILKALNIYNMNVLVPANICYAAVYPIILSSNKPIFVDVNNDANLSLEIIKNCKDDFAAAIIPHMYGNICLDIKEISNFFKNQGILMIEDCASSLGATIKNKLCGTFGDYGIFSFGYSKIIDIGGGGMIISKNNLSGIDNLLSSLPLFNQEIKEKLELLSKLYRLFRNTKTNDFILNVYNNILFFYKNEFTYHISDSKKKEIIESLNQAESIIKIRKTKQMLYLNSLNRNNKYQIYHFYDGSVPWRFNLLISQKYKKMFIKYALDNGLPISDWYPVVVDMFNEEKSKYVNAYKFEKMIINFPLLLDDCEIVNICNHINKFFEEVIQ